jgi:hypothetical protein
MTESSPTPGEVAERKCGICNQPRHRFCSQGECQYDDGSSRVCPNWATMDQDPEQEGAWRRDVPSFATKSPTQAVGIVRWTKETTNV